MNCKWCGGQGDEFGLMEIRGYDWDSTDEDALSFRQTTHQCVNGMHCARQVIANANNAEALQRVAADRENLGDLADQARQVLAHLSRAADAIIA